MKMNEPRAPSLAALEDHGNFVTRHIGTTDADQRAMLDAIVSPRAPR